MKNEDKYKTAEERRKAFAVFCDFMTTGDCGACKYRNRRDPSKMACPILWLADDADIDASDLMMCPFCGHKVEVKRESVPNCGTAYRAVCNCGYSSMRHFSIFDLAKSHNSVCRCVISGHTVCPKTKEPRTVIIEPEFMGTKPVSPQTVILQEEL